MRLVRSHAVRQCAGALLRAAALLGVATARPPPAASSCAAIQAQLDGAIARGDEHFQLPPGGIACPVDFQVLGARDLTISGAADGSTEFWFDPRMAGFRVMDSSNVTVRRLAVDHDPLPYVQLEITKITNASAAAPTYEFEAGVRSLPLERLDGSWGPIAQRWGWSGEGADRWVEHGIRVPEFGSNLLANRTGGGLRSLPGFPKIAGASEGDAITLMLRQYHTYVVGNSSAVTTEDVAVHSTKGLNFYELDGEGGHIYRRIQYKRRDGQLIASNADAFHSIDVAVGPTLEDSELCYCLDDFFVSRGPRSLPPAFVQTQAADCKP